MATLTGASISNAASGQQAFLIQQGQGLTIKDILDEILLLWGIQYAALAPRYLLKRAIHDMNAALQMIWALSKDVNYFSRQTLTVSFPAGVSQVNLPTAVLNVLGPARLASTKQILRPVSSRPQFDAFAQLFLGQISNSLSNGTPQAFWVERLNIAQPDNVQNIMHVVPAPAVTTSILLDVSMDAPRYEWNDYILATPVEMPSLYADSVLVPFCRYRAMSSHFMAQTDDRPTIVAEYQTALRLIGAVDPAMKEVQFAERASDKAAA